MSSFWSGGGGAARLAEGWGVKRGSVGVLASLCPGVASRIGVSLGGTDSPSGVAVSTEEGPDTEESQTWPPISWCVGS